MNMSLLGKTSIKRMSFMKLHSNICAQPPINVGYARLRNHKVSVERSYYLFSSHGSKSPTKLNCVLFRRNCSYSASKLKPGTPTKNFRSQPSSSLPPKSSPSSLGSKSKKPGEPLVPPSIATALGHGAFILTGLAYVTKDMLDLRLLVMGGISTSMIFQYCRPKPLWLPLKWNALFLTINVVMAGLLIQERQEADDMDEELVSIFEKGSFEKRGFSKVEFYRLFKIAKKMEKRQGDSLKQKGTRNNKLYFIEEGEASIVREGSILANITRNDFSGEIEFICFLSQSSDNDQKDLSDDNQLLDGTSEQGFASTTTMNEEETTMSSEDVFVTSPTMTVWYWDYVDLKELLIDNRGVSNALLAYTSHELREKLKDSWALRLQIDEEKRKIEQSALKYLLNGVVLENDSEKD